MSRWALFICPSFESIDSRPEQLLLATGVAIATYFFVPGSLARRRWLEWADAAGLAAFAVQGSAVALTHGVHQVVAVVMGVLTATGGGVVRDLLAGDRPLVCAGEPYASTAFAGALTFVALAAGGPP